MNPSTPWQIDGLLVAAAPSGEAVAWELEHAWPWPPWVTVLVVVVAVAMVVATYARESGAPAWLRAVLASMRLAAVGIVLVMVAQLVLALKRTGLPYLAVVLDDSLSMTIADRYPDSVREELERRVRDAGFDQPTRWNLARSLLLENHAALLSEIHEKYRLRLYYGTGPRPAALPLEPLAEEIRSARAQGPSTRLGEAIQLVLEELRGQAPAAVIVLTDGITTEGPGLAQAADQARRRGVPLYLVGLGNDQPVCDVKLTDVLADDVVFLGDHVVFEAKLSAAGYQGRTAQVLLRREDTQQVLAKTDVTLGPDGQAQPVRLAYRPTEEGEFAFVVDVAPLPGELQTANNRQRKTVRVRKEKIRVLLVDGEPRFEYRYLRNLLIREPSIALGTVLDQADREHVHQDSAALPSFPIRRDDLFGYDVVILGDVDPQQFSQGMLQNLVDFVSRPGKGGGLILIAGARFLPTAYGNTPLANLLPVYAAAVRTAGVDSGLREGFRLRPTELGLASPMFQLADTPAENTAIWGQLAPLYGLVEATDLKPGARVLAEHPTRLGPNGRPLPLVVLHYVGAGKVLFHATDETWRWRYRVGDLFFGRYWLQAIRTLARSKLASRDRPAALQTDRREYQYGEPVRLRLRFFDERLAPAEDDAVRVVVEYPDGKTTRVGLHRGATDRGVFQTTLEELPIGTYHAWAEMLAAIPTSPAVDFRVVGSPGEFARAESDFAEMRRAADQSRGRFYTFQSAGRLVDDLPEGYPVPLETLPPRPLWNCWPVLLAFLAFLVAEWFLRKRAGLA